MKLSNYQGALLGLAVGDALGATTENMRPEAIKRQYGKLTEIIGGGWLKLEAGHVTDDTEMTLAVANGIIRFNEAEFLSLSTLIGNEFIEWRDSNPVDIGNITRTSMEFYDICGDWRKAGKRAHEYTNKKSAGNGSLMRCLPVALAYGGMFMEGATTTQSVMTHYDPIATEACLIYNRIARRIINKENLSTAILIETKGTRYERVTMFKPIERPSGYVVDTLKWVLWVLYNFTSYEDVIVRLANEGSDSDTTAAIAGGLAGLYYGVHAIPERLSSKIIRKDEILATAEKLYNMSR